MLNLFKHTFLVKREVRIVHLLITVFVVFQIVVRPGPAELCEVLLVVELQEVGPLSAEPQEGGREAARQGHEALGAADIRDARGNRK